MNTPDFSGIDPLRVPEARRRVAALNEYLSLPNPSSNDTLRIAASIGLSRSQFCRLARVWRDHQDASLLVVGKRGPANRKYNVDQRAVSIAQELLAEAGPTASLALIAPQIEKRCAEAGISPPARSTINNYIKAARAGTAAPAAGPPRIVVGRMWFHIPIRLVMAHEIVADRFHRDNLELFAARRFVNIRPEHMRRFEAFGIQNGPSTTYGELARVIDPQCPTRGAAIIQGLTVLRRVEIDLRPLLTNRTPLCIH
ncbi:hypothetical protein [Sphingopyxis sp. MC1]|uniref:hypothetical protein n=1 Tax=Sphingopyxis sp. MC1 TaxID=1174684 RepID=UPI0003A88FA8|nr:hypothetical protein [Sphingopyxis sp. MC1]